MNIKKGSSILIHAASGGIGQAAINICLHFECNIFATVGTSEKVEFIRETYPQVINVIQILPQLVKKR